MVDNGTQVSASQGADGLPTPPTSPRPRPPAARRNTAMWTIVVSLVIVAVLTLWQGAQVGAFGVATVLAGAGVTRLVVPDPGLVGIVVRSRTLDTAMYFGLAAAVALLAQTAPNI